MKKVFLLFCVGFLLSTLVYSHPKPVSARITCPSGSACKSSCSNNEIPSGICILENNNYGTCCRPLLTQPPPPFRCAQEEQTRCVSNTIVEKCLGGQWAFVKNCAVNNQICVEGIGCTTKPKICDTPGQKACNGKTVIMCTVDQWQVIATCGANELCVAGQCTRIPSCQKSQGDANCDGVINMVDFENWRREFLGKDVTKTADFNSDGMIDLADFEVWRKGFFEPPKQTTPVREPTIPPDQLTKRPVPTMIRSQPTPIETEQPTTLPDQ